MTDKIFKIYFLWFNRKIASKSPILLIDRFLTYHTGLNLLQKKFFLGLINTKVGFLLANFTFLCQPLDQKIINA